MTETLICRFCLLSKSRVNLSQFISVIEALACEALACDTQNVHYYTDDLLPYVPLAIINATGDVVKVIYTLV